MRVGPHESRVDALKKQELSVDVDNPGHHRRHLRQFARTWLPCSMTETIARASIVGRGPVSSVTDILFLQGVDLGIVAVRHARLSREKGLRQGHQETIPYVTKL